MLQTSKSQSVTGRKSNLEALKKSVISYQKLMASLPKYGAANVEKGVRDNTYDSTYDIVCRYANSKPNILSKELVDALHYSNKVDVNSKECNFVESTKYTPIPEAPSSAVDEPVHKTGYRGLHGRDVVRRLKQCYVMRIVSWQLVRI